ALLDRLGGPPLLRRPRGGGRLAHLRRRADADLADQPPAAGLVDRQGPVGRHRSLEWPLGVRWTSGQGFGERLGHGAPPGEAIGGHHRNMVSRPLWAAWRALSIKPVGHGMPGEENLVLFTHSWNLTKLVGIEEAGPSGGRGPIR